MSETYADTFRRTVEEEQAAIKAEQEEKRMKKEAAHKQLEEARRAAQAIRDHIIHPMLTSLRESFTQGKVLPHWEVKLDEDSNQFSVLLTAVPKTATPGKSLDWNSKPGQEHDEVLTFNSTKPHGSWKKFLIKAVISVIDGGPSLSMSVVLPKEFGENHVVANAKNVVEFHDGRCDESAVTHWYQTQLEDCARRCVRFAAEEEKQP